MQVWTLTEASTEAGVSYTVGLRLVMTRKWRGWQEDGKWRVEAKSVRQWLAQTRTETSAASAPQPA